MGHRGAITGLLVDFDGVLRLWDTYRIADVERDHGLAAGSIHRVAFAPDLLLPAITGRVRDETWRETVAARLALDYEETVARAAVIAWSEACGRVDDVVRRLLHEARRRVRVGLLTNATSRLDADLAALGIAGDFDVIVNSSMVGVAKPDPAIFTEAARLLGTPVAETLYVDDTPANVAAGIAAGLRGYRHTDAAAFERVLREHSLVD